MQSNDLTRDQARALKNKVEPMLGYLGRLNERMARRGFPDDDPLRVAVADTLNAMHRLFAEVKCRSIDGKGCDESEKKPALDPLFTRTSKPRKHETHLLRGSIGKKNRSAPTIGEAITTATYSPE